MNASISEYLVHFSNVLMLVSYSVRDILWLRWFAVAAALTNMPYFLLQREILWPPVLWAGVFTAINVYQIAPIYLERRPVVLSDDEQRLYELGFRSLRPREFVQGLVNRDLAGKVERGTRPARACTRCSTCRCC
jgi:Popeye protein conserved region